MIASFTFSLINEEPLERKQRSYKGKPISLTEMVREMKGSCFIYIGETHNNLLIHNIQLKLLQALFKEDKQLVIGLEMFPLSCQETLNKWSLAILSLEDFSILNQARKN